MSFNKQETNASGMIGGVFVMAAGAGLNVVTMGQVGVGIAAAFAVKAGYDYLRGEKLQKPQENNDIQEP